HVAGDASLFMVINAHDKLPEISEKERYHLYNYAPLEATFTLKGIKPGSVVYCFEGQDWKTVRQVKDFDKPQKAKVDPCDMKLYLLCPKAPVAPEPLVNVTGALGVSVHLLATDTPYPVRVVLRNPDGGLVYDVFTAYGSQRHRVWFPLGMNAGQG